MLTETGRLASLALDDDLASRRALGKAVLPLRGSASRALPGHITQEIVRALTDHHARIPSRGLAELTQAVADWVGSDAGIAIDHEQEILVTFGAMHALSICFRALFQPEDRVVIPAPCFFFGGPVELAGVEPVYVHGSYLDGWRWDIEALEHTFDDRTRGIVLCNPENPTGHLPLRDELTAVIRMAERHDLLIVADESYERYVFDGIAHTPILSIPGARERTVLVRSMTKSFAMAGWRVGFLIAPAPLLARCLELFEWDCLRGNLVSQRAAAAALTGPSDWLEDIVPEYQRNREIAYAAVVETGLVRCVRPQSCPFLFVDLSALESPRHSPAESLRDAGVPLVPGASFQAPGYARIPFGGPRDAVEALAALLVELCSNVS